MVFQDYTSFDNRSVLENVAFGLECRGVPTSERLDRARAWISKVGLSVKKDADKYPHELSGGMRQRVAIARTLILEPRITIFFITHSIEEAVFLGDHILLFSNSPGTVLKTIRVPPPDRPSIEMQRDPKFQEVVTEIRDAQLADGSIVVLERDLAVQDAGCSIRARHGFELDSSPGRRRLLLDL